MSKTTHASKRKLQALQTRENLLRAGRITFLKFGFKKTTMTEINKEANTGYGTAYVYFKNKDDLFIELMESTMQKMYDVADLPFTPETKDDASKQIALQTRHFIELALEEKAMMRVVHEAIGISVAVQEQWGNIRNRFISEITRDIEYVQKIGLANDTLDASFMARGWFYLNEQFMWDLVLDVIDDDLEKIVTHLRSFYMDGLYV